MSMKSEADATEQKMSINSVIPGQVEPSQSSTEQKMSINSVIPGQVEPSQSSTEQKMSINSVIPGQVEPSQSSLRSSIFGDRPAEEEEAIVVSDLEVVGHLGRGSSGKVSKVRHQKTGKLYALKSVVGEVADAEREKAILKKLNSPYVVKSYGDDGSRRCLVLELMDSGTLADVIRRDTRVSEEQIAAYGKQILEGLSYLHANNIAHLDIKPHNILLNARGNAKLADFGITVNVDSDDDETCRGNAFKKGTPEYLSPERHRMSCQSLFASDIWSFGVLLAQCCGVPIDKGTVFRVWAGQPPEPPTDASPELQNLIKSCLNLDAALRPTADQLLRHPFFQQNENG